MPLGMDKHGNLYERTDLPTQAEKDAKAAERAAAAAKREKRRAAPQKMKDAQDFPTFKQAMLEYLGIDNG